MTLAAKPALVLALALSLLGCASSHVAPAQSPAATTPTSTSGSAGAAQDAAPAHKAHELKAAAAQELRVYVARHGETAWNVEHRLQGLTDVPLDDKGKHQAEALRDMLKSVPVDAVYSSTLSRSRDTARAVHGDDVTSIPELRERNWGKFQGKVVDADPALKEEFERRSKDPADALDGGESREQFFQRVDAGVKKILAEHPTGTVLIVGHSGTNQMVLRSLLGLTDAQAQQIDQGNDEVYMIELRAPPQLWKHVTLEKLGEL